MRIVLVTFGSRGDVQPMLALSLALKSAGHDVLLSGPPEKAAWAEEYGCPFHPLGSDLTTFIDSMPDAHTVGSAIRFVSYVYKETLAQFDVLPKIISGADLVVGASLVIALATVAEYMGIRYRFIAFTPEILPSRDHPYPAFKTQGLPKWYNRMTWMVMRIIDRMGLTRVLNRKRRQLGLSPVRDSWLHILGQDVIVASDKEIVELPSDLEITATQTGYLHLDQKKPYLKDLETFLSVGPPPVYVGFGSMPKHDQAGNVSMIVKAVRSAGQRAIIGKFWDGVSEFSNAEDIFFLRRYPHLDLFPRMAAVIHHGGAGTTATTAISGVPQIIVPHILDQYYWGHHIYRAQLGPKPIWRSKITSKKLSSAIRECLSNKQIQQNAKTTSELIKQKDSQTMTVRELLKAP